jgi:DNA polymerase I
MSASAKLEPGHSSAKSAILVDGSGYIFRAYYAVAPLSTSAGFPTNALLGFCRMLVKLIAEHKADLFAVVFDSGRLTFRNEIYPQYKANRQECPPELAQQMPYFREFCVAMGLPVFELPGYEADDVIGTLVKRLCHEGFYTTIISADKDLCQLVSDMVVVKDTMRDRVFDAVAVKEKFGVSPEQMIDYLSLTGDSSDNIPGLKGVGPKTAVQLLERYGSVEAIASSGEVIAADTSIRGRKAIAEQIVASTEVLQLSKQLVTIVQDAPLMLAGFSAGTEAVSIALADAETFEHSLVRAAPCSDKLSGLVEKFEMTSLFKDFAAVAGTSTSPKLASTYKAVTRDMFDGWVKALHEQKVFAFDLETTSLDPHAASVVGAAFCWDDVEAWYVPLNHCISQQDGDAQGERIANQVTWDTFVVACAPVLSNPEVYKVGQNLKFDASILLAKGIALEGIAHDTMVAAYLLHPDRNGRSLSALASEHFGYTMSEYSDVTAGLSSFAEVSIEAATNYAAEDAHLAWLLYKKLNTELAKEQLVSVMADIEAPLVGVLAEMEYAGVELDCQLLSEMSDSLGSRLQGIEREIYSVAGVEFNMNSPKQLSDVLFNQLGIPTKGLKKTKTGISTDSSVLEKLRYQHPLPGLILEYRGLFKLKSTYVDALPNAVNPITGRVHTRFNQTVTGTGRLSSSDPNLQNIPIQSPEGRRVRAAFRASTGNILISADYSQIELRLLAHLSEDPQFINAYVAGADIHAATASELLRVPIEEITPEQRRIGKTINFGIVYGMSGFRLGQDLGIPVSVASNYIENYFARYPGIRTLFDRLERDAESLGYVTTICGRRRYVEGIASRGRDDGFLRRAAINAPIQGSAADLVKLAMVQLSKLIKEQNLPLTMLLQIHDELVFECPVDFVDSARSFIKATMEGVMTLRVPLKVDVGQGENWFQAH